MQTLTGDKEWVSWILDCYYLLARSFTSAESPEQISLQTRGCNGPPQKMETSHSKTESYARKAKRPRPMEGRDEAGATWRFPDWWWSDGEKQFQTRQLLVLHGYLQIAHPLCNAKYMSREVVRRLRRGWSVDAFHLLPGMHPTRRRGRGLLLERCPRDAAVVRRDLLQSSWANAGAVEPWLPFELTVGELLDLTRRTDRLPWRDWEGLSHIAVVAASACRFHHRIGCPMWACQIHHPANGKRLHVIEFTIRSETESLVIPKPHSFFLLEHRKTTFWFW